MSDRFYNARISTTTASHEDLLKVVEFAGSVGIKIEVMQCSFALEGETGVATLTFNKHEDFAAFAKQENTK